MKRLFAILFVFITVLSSVTPLANAVDISSKETISDAPISVAPEEIPKTTITLTEVYETSVVAVVLRHVNTQTVYTLKFDKNDKYTASGNLLPGKYSCESIKGDTDAMKLTFPNEITINGDEAPILISVNETIIRKTLKDIFMDNVFLLLILVVLVIVLAINKKRFVN